MARRTSAGTSRTAPSAAAEKLAEKIAEITELGAAAEVRTTAASACRSCRRLLARVTTHHLFLRRAALPIGAKFVVFLALLRVADYLVGLVDFLELDLGVLVVGIDIRMVLARQLAIRTLDLSLASSPRNAKSLIVIAKFHPVLREPSFFASPSPHLYLSEEVPLAHGRRDS